MLGTLSRSARERRIFGEVAVRCGVMRLTSILPALALALVGCASEGTNPKPPTGTDSPLGDRPDLPIDERLDLANLSGKVDVVRDDYGRPHIYATNTNDAMRVEGYLVALDRTMQLEFFRRYAE